MDQQEIKNWLSRYMNDELSSEEREHFMQLLEKQRYTTDWEDMVEELSALYPAIPFDQTAWDPVVNNIIATGKERERPVRRMMRVRRWAAAAAILVVVTGGYFIYLQQSHPATIPTASAITPGKNGAVLTLADGTQVEVDSLGNGVVATQNGAQVLLKNGQLAYNVTGNATREVQYNIMSTPKGRHFSVVLPDGTNVWLNAASTIRYPVVFSGNERLVEVTGEAYFEVNKDAAKPFRVMIKGRAEVAVLGTRFNVNAYADDAAISTTLIDGSIGVKKYNASERYIVLKPGQQAQISQSVHVQQHVDIDKVMAWKNGLFNFEGVGLQDAMHQLERWYDIEVVYENGIPDIQFFGEIDRKVELKDLLQILSNAKLKFRIEGRKLIVM